MRTLFVIGLILGCAFMAGWFTVNRDDGETTIRINKDEIRSDARAAINRGKNYINEDGTPDDGQFASQQDPNFPMPSFQGQQQYQQQPGYGQQQAGYAQQQYQPQPGYNQPQGQPVPANWANSGFANQQPALNPPANGQGGGIYMPPPNNANQPPAPWQQQNYQAQPQQPQRQF